MTPLWTGPPVPVSESDRSRPRDLSELAVDDSTVDRTSGSCLVEESTGGTGGFAVQEMIPFCPSPLPSSLCCWTAPRGCLWTSELFGRLFRVAGWDRLVVDLLLEVVLHAPRDPPRFHHLLGTKGAAAPARPQLLQRGLIRALHGNMTKKG